MIHMVATAISFSIYGGRSIESTVRIVKQEEVSCAPVTTVQTSAARVWTYIGMTMVLLAVIDTWLVWFSACNV